MLTVALRGTDRAEFVRLRALRAAERELLRLSSLYLNRAPRLITREMLEPLQRDCHVCVEEAYCALLEATLIPEEREKEAEMRYVRRKLLPRVIRRADPAVYRRDPYYAGICVRECRTASLHLTHATYAPYEGFAAGNLLEDEAGYAELPPIGFFEEEFSYPVLYAEGREWMAIKPSEIETMRAPLRRARGHVLMFGLGLGYFAYMAAAKPEVSRITVVERDARIRALFESELLPQFAERKKIEIVEADAFCFAEEQGVHYGYDYAFVDLWHDVSDGLDMYLRMRRAEKHFPGTEFGYWIEDYFLSHLRGYVMDALCEAADGGKSSSGTGGKSVTIDSMDGIRKLLSAEYLRRLSPDLYRIGDGEHAGAERADAG